MPTESTFLLAGLFLLLVAMGWALGRFGERDEENDPPLPLNIDYLKGLNFLLNEQTDQALEHFLKMVRVDNKTIETHFALGNLFRRRGEIDRAIRIHQNIIARPDIAPEQRDQALFSLAKDYLKAGLLDRAENLFIRLTGGSFHQLEAFEQLSRIYEQEHEWQKAINVSEQLATLSGNSLELEIAHYYCELAEQAASENDYTAAHQFVKKSQSGQLKTLRGSLTHAEIARDSDDTKTALRLFNHILEQHTYLITEALPELVDIHEREGSIYNLERGLELMLEKNPEMKTDIAYTAIVNNIHGIDVIDECVERYMLKEPTLGEFIDLQYLQNGGGDKLMALNKIRAALSKLAKSTPQYQCKECGFSSRKLLWQCPSCKDWETQRPFARIQFDSLLQRSSNIS